MEMPSRSSADVETSSGAKAAYTIVGAGAIGGTLAYHLGRAGHAVTVVDTDPEHVASIARDGVTVVRGGGKDGVAVRQAITVDEEVDGPITRVLLAVKAQHTAAAMQWVGRRLAPDGFVVSLQNGLNEPVIAASVGWPRTVGAFVNLFADVVGPGEIQDGGAGALVVGELDGRNSARVHSVVTDLQAWGPARATSNVTGFLWSKLGFGAMLVATALADAPMADLIDRHRTVMHGLVSEVFAVACAEGIALEPFDAFDPMPYAGRDPAVRDQATDHLVKWLRTQTKDRSGFWRDLAVRRRGSEAHAHYEPVLARARMGGHCCPGLETLLAEVRAIEHGAPMTESRLMRVGEAIWRSPRRRS
jgi:2-dehydropantoate 2-reductase